MGKRIKMIKELMAVAKRNGKSERTHYKVYYSPETNLWVLSHYGTNILRVENGKIIGLGGYSQSDADSIETALNWLGFRVNIYRSATKARKYGATPMGNFYIR